MAQLYHKFSLFQSILMHDDGSRAHKACWQNFASHNKGPLTVILFAPWVNYAPDPERP
jgi:hypothetical protein